MSGMEATDTLVATVTAAKNREVVAEEYARCLGDASVSWGRVNAAICARWSMAALRYIKKRAWRRNPSGQFLARYLRVDDLTANECVIESRRLRDWLAAHEPCDDAGDGTAFGRALCDFDCNCATDREVHQARLGEVERRMFAAMKEPA